MVREPFYFSLMYSVQVHYRNNYTLFSTFSEQIEGSTVHFRSSAILSLLFEEGLVENRG